MLDVNSVNEIGVKCRLIHNICKVRLPLRKNISDGIEVIDVINGKDIIEDIRVIKDKFSTINGGRVRLNKLVRGKTYTLIENVNIPCTAVMIPNGKSITILNKTYSSGKVVVAITGKLVVIEQNLFRRMFIVDENVHELTSRINKCVIKNNTDVDYNRRKTAQEEMAEKFSKQFSQENNVSHEDIESDEDSKKIEVVMQITDIDGKIVGFAAVDKKGKKYKLSYNKILQMTRKGLVSNLKIVKSAGKEELKGYAMKIENLPRVYK